MPVLDYGYRWDIKGEEATVAAGDKMRSRVRAATGRTRQRLGEATGDPQLAREGQVQRRRGNLRLALEKLKDAFRR